MKTNRICKVCGKAYYYCVSCSQAVSAKPGFEPWHILVHDENCKLIFETLQKHFLKEYTTAQARGILKTCDLSVLTDSTKKQVDEIMRVSTPKKIKAPVEKVIPTIN